MAALETNCRKWLVTQLVFHPWSWLSCAFMNAKSLLGLKKKLDKFWKKIHWMAKEMDTEPVNAKRSLA